VEVLAGVKHLPRYATFLSSSSPSFRHSSRSTRNTLQRLQEQKVETLFGSLKVERPHDMRFETRRQAKDEIVDWLIFYSRNRMHSTLGYTSPMAFEENWRRQQETLAA
jgi:transposase InsO family protein